MIFQSHGAKITGLALSLAALLLLFAAGHVYGYAETTWSTAWRAFLHYDGSNEHVIIREIRLPRSIVASLVGAALAVSGAIMQALTRNPMASPGILGINAGAGFFIVTGVAFFSLTAQSELVWLALAGALTAAISVYLVSSVGPEGVTPLKLTLAGATLAALFSAFTSALLIADEKTLDSVLFWLAGAVEGRTMEHLMPMLPFFFTGLLASMFLGRPLNVITAGEDIAKGLGQNTLRVKLVSLLLVVLLSGGAVSIAGPIGFIGLVIPHIVRGLVGVDHRYVLPYCAVLGAVLLIAADIGARFIAFPKEVPVGVMTAIIGAPFFIYLARKELIRR